MAAGEGPVKMEDLTGVRSRISWQAILAGAIAAIATNLVFTLFFAAIGITLTEAGVRENAVGVGALIATMCSVIISLFVGGWVAAQLTAGETEREAVLYGILTWATVVGISIMMVGIGVRAGYFALVGGAMVAQQSPEVRNSQSWEEAAKNAGVPQERIDAAKASVDPNRARAVANDPATQQKAHEALVAASWAVLVGVLLSLGASIGGALVGRGPALQLIAARQVQVEARRELIIP
jgi:hypothetical protein